MGRKRRITRIQSLPNPKSKIGKREKEKVKGRTEWGGGKKKDYLNFEEIGSQVRKVLQICVLLKNPSIHPKKKM